MFISIPREFFVPVIFGEGFVLNEENNNLEIDTNMYRESAGKKVSNESVNMTYLNESKSSKEKQDIIDEKIDMDGSKCGNSTAMKNSITNKDENLNKGNTFYMTLKDEKEMQKACKNYGEIFKGLDDEFIESINTKGCNGNNKNILD